MKKLLICFLVCLSLLPAASVSAQEIAQGKYYTSLDGTRIYYEVKGSGYPIVLIHGFTGTSQGWKRGKLYSNLIAQGYQVIILDQRGNGLSDKPHTDAAYANDAEAKDIMGLVSSMGIKVYHAVGYSRGSIITSRLMVLDKRVKKAVMGGMGADYTNPEWPRRIHAYKALMGDTTQHDVDDMMVWINKNPFDKLALAYQQKHQPSTSRQQLAKVKMPVLLIDGSEDTTNGDVAQLQKLIPNAVMKTVPGDHNNAGNSVQFSEAVIAFLK
ncbi:alpha/beta fold hydrolase [Mucilaginibacter sp.]|uniref:alpha/beta fold hydrolase n=1 Tax=Mucilaginibacter sp. TaxID=1882438 RepID=UPI0035BC8C5B